MKIKWKWKKHKWWSIHDANNDELFVNHMKTYEWNKKEFGGFNYEKWNIPKTTPNNSSFFSHILKMGYSQKYWKILHFFHNFYLFIIYLYIFCVGLVWEK